MELYYAYASDNNVPNYLHTPDSFFRSCFSTRPNIAYHLKNTKIHYWVHNSLPLVPILCQMYQTTNSKPVPYVPFLQMVTSLQFSMNLTFTDFYQFIFQIPFHSLVAQIILKNVYKSEILCNFCNILDPLQYRLLCHLSNLQVR